MNTSDAIMIIAVLLGPILAVQASEFIQRRREDRGRRLHIFKTLMATRASNLSLAHVEALNMIDLEFYGKDKKSREVLEAWKIYLDHLNDRSFPAESWGTARIDLLIDLLQKMAKCLGFDFDKVHIKRTSYFPTGYGDFENEQNFIRKSIVKILSGEIALPVQVIEPVPGSNAAENKLIPGA